MNGRISFFGPLFLITTGVVWIIIQAGTVPASNLWALAFLWPFLLILLGAGLILRGFWKYSWLFVQVLILGGVLISILYAPKLGWNHMPDSMLSGDIYPGGGVSGSGHVVTENRALQNFSSIRLSYPAQITLEQGNTESVTIIAEDNVAADILTQVTNGVLEIDRIKDHPLRVQPTQPVKIKVVFKDLAQIDLETAGQVILNGLSGDGLTVVMNGAGSMALNGLNLGSFKCNLSGAGSINANGTSKAVDLQMDGLGSFNGGDLHSQTASVRLDGLGSATVWADTTLTAELNGLGSITYYGNPQVTKTVDGLGTINHAGNK
jgi:Putative auto-transporter adhesin, head GIN domain